MRPRRRIDRGPRTMSTPRPVSPDRFFTKWKTAELKERAAAHSHFIDLCRLLDEPAPTDADRNGKWYAFERGATKTTGGEGWACSPCLRLARRHFRKMSLSRNYLS
jgi:hypothetical protein